MQEYLNQQFPLGPGDLSLHPAGFLDDVVDLREERAAGEDRPGACRSTLRSSAGFEPVNESRVVSWCATVPVARREAGSYPERG